MDAKHWGLIILAVVLLGTVLVLGDSWLGAHEDQVRLSATLDAQKSVIAAAERRELDRGEQLRVTLEQLATQKKAVVTPEQVVRSLPEFLPPLPVAPQVVVPPATAGEPAGQPSLRIPPEDLKPLYDFALDCRACQAERAALRQNLDDEHAKEEALTKERDAAVRAARGGSFWTRTKRAAKWLGIGIVIGVAARSAAH